MGTWLSYDFVFLIQSVVNNTISHNSNWSNNPQCGLGLTWIAPGFDGDVYFRYLLYSVY